MRLESGTFVACQTVLSCLQTVAHLQLCMLTLLFKYAKTNTVLWPMWVQLCLACLSGFPVAALHHAAQWIQQHRHVLVC